MSKVKDMNAYPRAIIIHSCTFIQSTRIRKLATCNLITNLCSLFPYSVIYINLHVLFFYNKSLLYAHSLCGALSVLSTFSRISLRVLNDTKM